MTWKPASLWEYMVDKTIDDYVWKKEDRIFAKCYVCYHNDKEIGFIPVEYEKSDEEWKNWWQAARKRFKGCLCIEYLMLEIMDRHKRRTS